MSRSRQKAQVQSPFSQMPVDRVVRITSCILMAINFRRHIGIPIKKFHKYYTLEVPKIRYSCEINFISFRYKKAPTGQKLSFCMRTLVFRQGYI